MFGTSLSEEEKLIREKGRKLTKAEKRGLLKAEAAALVPKLLRDAQALEHVGVNGSVNSHIGEAADLLRRLSEEVRS